MSQLDVTKETIAYLKFWLGVLVVSAISLVGWLLSNAGKTSELKIYGAIIAVSAITISALFIHKQIEFLISTLKEL